MTSTANLFRSLVTYAVCLTLAIWVGYLWASSRGTVEATFTVVVPLCLLCLPMLLRWHFAWMLACWNMDAVLYFLPGRPAFWTLLIPISFTISLLQYVLDRRKKFIAVPSVTKPLICLAVIVLVTARLTGGIGINSLGGGESVGGRRYVWLLFGILGYFALSAHRIPLAKAKLYTTLFLIGFVTFAIGSTAGQISSSLNFIFLMFPPDTAGYVTSQASNSVSGPVNIIRFGGFSTGALGMIYILLLRYGVDGTFRTNKLWRPVLCLGLMVLSLCGGYRSMAITVILTTGLMLYFEGALRTRLLPALCLATILGFALLIPFAQNLPLPIQRALTFLPVKFSPDAEDDAKGTTEWRTKMWAEVLPDVPDHLILGKGYSINTAEMEQIKIASDFSHEDSAALGAKIAGDYHNGPLSVIIPFGVFGAIAFLWFLYAGYRALYRNYRYGDPELVRVNRFLLAFYLMKIAVFFGIFGSLYSDFVGFTGVIGLSVALNGGLSSPVPVTATRPAQEGYRLSGASRPFRGAVGSRS